jgi:SnoaL-like domain
MSDIDLQQLHDDLRYVKDRWEILDCINHQSRGHDRHDLGLMAGVYHDDGIDEHGPTVNAAAEYGKWANAVHGAAFDQHAHNITTHTCEIDGDTAHCESYVIVEGRRGTVTTLMGGRYLDRLERREGKWKIALRRLPRPQGVDLRGRYSAVSDPPWPDVERSAEKLKAPAPRLQGQVAIVTAAGRVVDDPEVPISRVIQRVAGKRDLAGPATQARPRWGVDAINTFRVIVGRFTLFRVVGISLSAGQLPFCAWFDSRQLHLFWLVRALKVASGSAGHHL